MVKNAKFTCLFCHRIYAFLSENSVREIQHNNSSGTNRVSIRFPTFPARALSSPCLVLMSIASDICTHVEGKNYDIVLLNAYSSKDYDLAQITA